MFGERKIIKAKTNFDVEVGDVVYYQWGHAHGRVIQIKYNPKAYGSGESGYFYKLADKKGTIRAEDVTGVGLGYYLRKKFK